MFFLLRNTDMHIITPLSRLILGLFVIITWSTFSMVITGRNILGFCFKTLATLVREVPFYHIDFFFVLAFDQQSYVSHNLKRTYTTF